MITRQYKKACDFCGASGKVFVNGTTTIPYETCPVCNGSKTVLVTEQVSEPNSNIVVNKDILLT